MYFYWLYRKTTSRVIFITLLVFIAQNSFSQHLEGAYWYWGGFNGLHFNPSPSFDTNNSLQGYQGRATISTKDGELLLYSDLLEIKNGNHITLVNGNAPISIGLPSVGQALLSGLPRSDSLYFHAQISSTPGINPNRYFASLYFSLIDVTAANDTGMVLPNFRWLNIRDSLANKLALVQHANGEDFWLLCHSYEGNTFYSFLIDESGINTTPVVTSVGKPYNPRINFDGFMKSSPNSELLALVKNDSTGYVSGHLELFQFDRNTGQPYNPIEIYIPRIFASHYGCSFSPNSNKLFFPHTQGTPPGSSDPDTTYLLQYDISTWDSFGITNSCDTVGRIILPSSTAAPDIFDLQIGIDGNLYFVRTVPETVGKVSCPNLSRPNVLMDSAYIVLPVIRGDRSIPTLNQTLFVNAGILQAQSQSGDVCLGDTAQLIAYGAGADRFIWSLEDGSPAGNLSDDTLPNPRAWPDTTTTYRVIGISSSCTSADGEDTAFVTVRVGQGPDEPLFPDSVSRCVNDTFNAQLPAATPFWWSTGTDSNGVALTQSETYRYVYADSLGCASDTFSFTLNFFDSAVVELDADSQLCVFEEGRANIIFQTAVNWTAAAQVVESDSFFIRYRADSSFWLRAVPQDSNACAVSDSVFVTVIPTPNAGDDFDTVMCLPDSFSFIPNAPQLQNLRFVRESTGDTLQPQDFPKRLFLNDILNETFIVVNPENCTDTVHVSAEVLIPETEPEGRYEMRRDCDETVLRIFPQSGIEWYFNGNRIGIEDLPVTVGDSFLIAEYDESRRCLNTSRLIIGEGSAKLDVELPNVFTPNHDGVNDLFEPIGPINHVCGILQVYNRWGNLIYENREGAGISWDGRNTSGNPVPVGTYFYVYTSGNEVVKGSVQVLR